jgi:hypothetical protein
VNSMSNENGPITTQRLIAEVAARHNILLKPDDAAFALVTINQLVLGETMERVHAEIRETIAGFNASYEKAERRAGSILAQMVRAAAIEMRKGLQNDVRIAGLKAQEFVHLVNEAHRRPALMRWSAVGLVVGGLLFGGGFWLGLLLH